MYEIHVLENDEFDKLPFKHAKSSLGMANAKTGVAYIRRTGIEGLDAGTIRHEFDELLQKTSPHEEDGIRYKSGRGLGSWLSPILGSLAYLVNPALGIAVGAGIKAGTAAHSSSVKPEKYGENSFGSVLKNAAVGGISAYGAGSLAKGGLAGIKAAGARGAGGVGKAVGAFKGAVGLPIGAANTGSAALATPAGYTGSVTLPGIGSVPGASVGAGSSGLGGAINAGIGKASAASSLRGITPSAFSAGTNASLNAAPSLTQRLATGAKGLARSSGKTLAGNALVSSLAPPQSTAISGTEGVGGPGGFGNNPTNILELFGRSSGASGADFVNPYSQEDFNSGLSKINQQAAGQTNSVFDTFRRSQPGANIKGSSAFANQLAAVSRGNTANVNTFTQQTNDANTTAYNQYNYNGVKNANGLSDAKMQEYIRLARQPDSVIRSQFPGMSPDDFRNIFEGLESFA